MMWALLKSKTRQKQRTWASETAARLAPHMPPGVKCSAAGWYPGCEPALQFSRLEWVGLSVQLGEITLYHEFYYPANPTIDDALKIARGLMQWPAPCMRITDGEWPIEQPETP